MCMNNKENGANKMTVNKRIAKDNKIVEDFKLKKVMIIEGIERFRKGNYTSDEEFATFIISSLEIKFKITRKKEI